MRINEICIFPQRMRNATPTERIEAFIERIPFSGCWIWMKVLTETGYGQCWNGSRMEGAHRCSWRAFVGPIPADLDVLHHCDVRCCVNPAHLYLGTHQQNMDDMMSRNRHRAMHGEENGFAKLTDKGVAAIKFLYGTREFTQKQLADQFSCSQQLISRITRGEHR